MSDLPFVSSGAIDAAAAQWLARRDRGLTAREQDAYLQWLRSDPRHPAALALQEEALKRMMHLREWQPALSSEPNPDLFAPLPRRRVLSAVAMTLGVAAALTAAFVTWWRPTVPAASFERPKSYLRVIERQALTDGSLVGLRDGSRIDVQYSPAVRRVKLSGGEAHFTVTKNPERPFIVEAGGVEIRAVGTAFNVRLDVAAVEVLVTEGKVRLATPVVALGKDGAPAATPFLSAGEHAIISLSPEASQLQITNLTPEQIQEALAWQVPRLQFYETPLAEAVAEFNQYAAGRGQRKLVLGEPALGAVPIGGTFRVDNVDGFVRLLKTTLEISSEARGSGEIVLTSAH